MYRIVESVCRISETDITLYLNYTSIFFKKCDSEKVRRYIFLQNILPIESVNVHVDKRSKCNILGSPEAALVICSLKVRSGK